ncbi:uncharacterized protein LOC105254772 [Camponotus floridanus]|uniref:uncharacterized protein LOC105254772 n=1 Tax=Camponotus floridanus TaxID=104421 RepID=UPI000DC6B417|nr:uncharacterized protein LOC105254772 [Camponotus floridanus]
MPPPDRYAEMSLEELHEEACGYRLTNIPDDRTRCIELLMAHLKTNGPLREMQHSSNTAVGEEEQPTLSTPGSPRSEQSNQYYTIKRGTKVNENTLDHLCTALTQQLKLQNESMKQQQQLFQQMLAALSVNQGQMSQPSQPVVTPSFASTQDRPYLRDVMGAEGSTAPAGNSVKFLSSQIPTFGASEEEDVELWIEKIESVAEIHRLSSVVMLSAAAVKLTKSARRWFDLSSGEVNRSWLCFRAAITDRFKKKILYDVVRKRAEARKWNPISESFQDYSMEKLALMRNLKLEDGDAIQLLISGINDIYVKCIASSLRVDSLNQFLREMQHITGYCGDSFKRVAPVNKFEKFKEGNPKFTKTGDSNSTSAKGALQLKTGKAELHCVYCRGKDHIRNDCPKLKKKEAKASHPTNQPTSVAAVESLTDVSSEIACVQGNIVKKSFADPVVKVVKLDTRVCDNSALVDTGSPISFINASVFSKFSKSRDVSLKTPGRCYKTLNGQVISILGIWSTSIIFKDLPTLLASIDLHVLKNDAFSADLIIGRDFLSKYEIDVSIRTKEEKVKVELFSEIAFIDSVEESTVPNVLLNLRADLDQITYKKLVSTLQEVENIEVTPPQQDYFVTISLKDDSVFAYAPRRFAWAERIKIREITDDLLDRGIIKPSTSPYCARVVPVRKKNGTIRLCVDLRPLNSRVVKQKYPFPLIEDCLSRLSDRSIFTLLDLKDGFYNIKLHPDVTKYFAFATPDGQFEYTRLPFGYCEAPAEFQKRLIQILRPLIKDDKIIVYIDDILIPSFSIAENLSTLKLVLIELKREGKKMAHVDALSRVVNLVEALPLEKELEYRQLQDPRLKFLARDLEFESHEKFDLIEGLVFRKGPDKPRFVIPESMIMNILRISR